MTGFSAKVRALILERDGGCIICGETRGVQIHHRAPRQMGGSKNPWVNQPPNGVTLCADHHRWVESNRADAEKRGFIVRRGVKLPADVPVLWRGQSSYLTHEGRVEPNM